MVAAYLLMPRRAAPRDHPGDEELPEARAEELARLQRWLNYTRLAYFFVAVIVLLLVPELV